MAKKITGKNIKTFAEAMRDAVSDVWLIVSRNNKKDPIFGAFVSKGIWDQIGDECKQAPIPTIPKRDVLIANLKRKSLDEAYGTQIGSGKHAKYYVSFALLNTLIADQKVGKQGFTDAVTTLLKNSPDKLEDDKGVDPAPQPEALENTAEPSATDTPPNDSVVDSTPQPPAPQPEAPQPPTSEIPAEPPATDVPPPAAEAEDDDTDQRVSYDINLVFLLNEAARGGLLTEAEQSAIQLVRGGADKNSPSQPIFEKPSFDGPPQSIEEKGRAFQTLNGAWRLIKAQKVNTQNAIGLNADQQDVYDGIIERLSGIQGFDADSAHALCHAVQKVRKILTNVEDGYEVDDTYLETLVANTKLRDLTARNGGVSKIIHQP